MNTQSPRIPSVGRHARHALVIGGTGMLRDVSLQLARDGWITSIIARSEQRLVDLANAADAVNGKINAIALDYRDSEALQQAIHEFITRHGQITLVVAWIHSSVAPDAARVIAEAVAAASDSFRFVHVVGSIAASPEHENTQQSWLERITNMQYRSVLLGFVIESDGASRWLTDDEIAQGVLRAIRNDAQRTIVGVIEPWDKRP